MTELIASFNSRIYFKEEFRRIYRNDLFTSIVELKGLSQYRNEINEKFVHRIVEERIDSGETNLYTKLSLDHSLYFECFYIGLVDNSLFLSWPPTRQPFFFFLSIYCLRLSWPLFARGTFEDTCLF